ncbi:ATP-dependent RNA helicase HrpA [Kushneria phosphatilytica]|uniref:ATP-dependent RNA helicase HrpA n=1 Tax=Kushneria phosphatilytica TaxID=657387 RepID=A0A1S1NV52_9GAMM|nr:ATP-dependent RNA helicase HrpA [Kushneria phosphatilytica]OHV10250.1 ATP-dependent RNA helicase HrpA [Kushneria phosphatilytica]QEL11549.1 ATP-dependent RNA helicase HrpA [Kushneria phosphatilytica]
MSDTATDARQQLQTLRERLSRTTLSVAHDQGSRLERLEARARRGQPIDRAISDVQTRLDRSIAQVETRLAQPLGYHYPAELPVVEKREDISRAIAEHQVVVVAGETGSGKTTQLPKLCLELGLGARGLIGHTQPRRLAARSVASRLAEEMETPLGGAIGYQVRFTDQTAEQTRVKLMTDGILLAETRHDPDLRQYEAIIIDEAHERSLNIDFLLGYLRRLLDRRPDLKVIITSATIDVDRFAQHFGSQSQPAPVIEVSGRAYPVETRYRPLVRQESDEEDLTLQEGILQAVEEVTAIEREHRWFTGPRDILIFLPGEREIRETADTLRRAQLRDTEVLPLYARLSNAEQNRVFSSHTGRRIVLSTNVAETSLTVPGIRYVIDPGLVRISRYSYRAKVQRLPIEPISQASADQRRGRCGRVAEGVCLRLYSEEDYLSRPTYTEPEIQRTNLASVILAMLSLKLGDISNFPFIDPPDGRFVKDGFRLLFELGAVDERNRLTRSGQRLSRLPIDPRLGRMVLAGAEYGSLTETLIVVSALSIQDPRERPADKREAADQAHRQWQDKDSDFAAWINLWRGFEAKREELTGSRLRRWCRDQFLSYLRLREWHDTYRQLRQLARELELGFNSEPADVARLHQALLSGLLSNLGLLNEQREYLGARNRKFLIHPASGLAKRSPKWVMAGELVETSRLFAREVAAIKPEWIEPLAGHLVKRSVSEPHWEMKRGQVVAFEQVTLFGLPIVARRKVHYGPIAPQEARDIFIRSALVEGQFSTKGEFFEHNRALIDEVEDLEDRARKRDILVDEETLVDFYDQRLPEDIYTVKGFERWRSQAEAQEPRLLFLDRETLLAREASEVTVEQYPDELELGTPGTGSRRYPLSYHFAPGAEDDGVTLTVPAAMLSTLPRERLEWLVPGLRRDKAIALMKSLPKQYRRQVVPIPDWVDAALETVTPDNTPLHVALGEFMRRRTGIRLPADAWQPEQLPEHLHMNIRVVDHEGHTLGQGRDLDALIERFEADAREGARAMAGDELSRSGLTGFPGGELPESHVRDQAGIRVEAWPALVDEGDTLGVALFDHPARAHYQHRHGIKRLAMRRLPDQVRWLSRDIPGLERSVLLFANVGSRRDLIDDFVAAVFLQVFAFDPLPRDAEAFEARLNAERGRIGEVGETLLARVEAALEGHLKVSKMLKGRVSFNLARSWSDVKGQMQRLVHPGFISLAEEWLRHYPRYMEAAGIRLEKAPREPRRDQLSMDEVNALQTRLDERRARQENGGIRDPELETFGWWLEELRVSLFAQQLGTLAPVSVQRLERRWQELVAV